MARFWLANRFEPVGKPLVCIVAVQGLWANPNYTWTNNGVNWLQDLLPVDLPSARILSFEPVETPQYSIRKAKRQHLIYLCGTLGAFFTIVVLNSAGIASLLAIFGSILSLIAPLIDSLRTTRQRLAETFSTELEDEAHQLASCIETHRLREHDESPIILIGHSFGGLVVKQALASADISSETMSFMRSIIGIIFVGTPHQGSGLASFGVYVSRLFMFRDDFISLLSVGSEYLAQLDKDFQAFSETSRAKIVSFYERHPTKYGIGWLAIPIFTAPESSTKLKSSLSIGMDTNHSYMVKYRSQEDQSYQQMLHIIREILAHGVDAQKQFSEVD